jgi:hypothetical protein
MNARTSSTTPQPNHNNEGCGGARAPAEPGHSSRPGFVVSNSRPPPAEATAQTFRSCVDASSRFARGGQSFASANLTISETIPYYRKRFDRTRRWRRALSVKRNDRRRFVSPRLIEGFPDWDSYGGSFAASKCTCVDR